LKPGDAVFDIGANFGIYSVHAARLVGSAGAVYAFEPVPTTQTRLFQTLALNDTRDVHVVPIAVTAENGEVPINVFDDPSASGWSSLGTHTMMKADGQRVQPGKRVMVKGQTLDDFASEAGVDRVAFCKIDVEGFEADVFAGAERMLSEKRIDVICFELSEDPLAGENRRPLDVLLPLAKQGYQIFRHEDAGLVGPVDPQEEERQLIEGDKHPYCSNYFASATDALAGL
jgi:FkbM family methyltransferase